MKTFTCNYTQIHEAALESGDSIDMYRWHPNGPPGPIVMSVIEQGEQGEPSEHAYMTLTDDEATAIAVALIQATPRTRTYENELYDLLGKLAYPGEAIAFAMELIRAAARKNQEDKHHG